MLSLTEGLSLVDCKAVQKDLIEKKKWVYKNLTMTIQKEFVFDDQVFKMELDYKKSTFDRLSDLVKLSAPVNIHVCMSVDGKETFTSLDQLDPVDSNGPDEGDENKTRINTVMRHVNAGRRVEFFFPDVYTTRQDAEPVDVYFKKGKVKEEEEEGKEQLIEKQIYCRRIDIHRDIDEASMSMIVNTGLMFQLLQILNKISTEEADQHDETAIEPCEAYGAVYDFLGEDPSGIVVRYLFKRVVGV